MAEKRPGVKRPNVEREKRLEQTAELYLKGKPVRAIAEIVQVSKSQVDRDLAEIRQRWAETAIDNAGERIRLELEKLDVLERTYWDAWERSGGRKIKRRKESGNSAGEYGGPWDKESVDRWTEVGDPRYLAGVQWCIDRRTRLLGLDAPEKREISGRGGGAIQVEDVDNGRANRIVTLLDRARDRRVGSPTQPSDPAPIV